MPNGNFKLSSPNFLTRETLEALRNEGGIPTRKFLVLNNIVVLAKQLKRTNVELSNDQKYQMEASKLYLELLVLSLGGPHLPLANKLSRNFS